MNRIDEATIQRTAAALTMAALCLVVPRFAHAELSHEALWGDDDPTACATPRAEARSFEAFVDEATAHGTETADTDRAPATGVSKATLAAECMDAAPDQSETSNNLCFEKAGVPASVVPALAAKAKALDQTETLVDQARELIGLDEVPTSDRRVASRTHPIAIAPPSQPNRDESCTARPDSCHSLPPLPPTLTVDATATAPYLPAASPEIPAADRRDDTAIPERLRVFHADGYRSPPLKPPRRPS